MGAGRYTRITSSSYRIRQRISATTINRFNVQNNNMQILNSALQYSSWPIVTLIGLFVFKAPLSVLIKNLRFLRAGKLEVSFEEQIQRLGFSEEQLRIVRTLSAQEIDLFLLVTFSDSPSFNYMTGLHEAAFSAALKKLQEAGLIVITNPDGPSTNLRHITTPIGHRVRTMLINSTVALLHARS